MQTRIEQELACFPEALQAAQGCLDQFSKPFAGLESRYKQQKFFRENFGLLEPVERVLGRRYELKNGRSVEVVDCCYDIPLLKSLELLLATCLVQEQVFNSHSSPDEKITDYCDGTQYKGCELFQEDPCSLQIQLYYDEIDVCNEIGSRSTVHKLGVVYYTLGNLHPKYRSALKGIHLLNSTYFSLIQRYGIDSILQPIVDSVKCLEEENGVEFIINQENMRFRGTITVFSADNLSAQLVGGFKALNSAFRKCRYCMATDATMQTKFREEDFDLRTRANFAAHCAGLEGPLHDHIATTFGVTRSPLLNSCKYFHVVHGLVPDVMHDILEGSLPLLTKLLLTYYIKEQRLFSLADLNSRILSFKYGSSMKSKPSIISTSSFSSNDAKLRQSASQMWCLARFLPLMIGDLIALDDDHWENFITFLDIMDYVLSPTTTAEKMAYVSVLLGDFLTEFLELYNRSLIPKMHYLLHVPSWILRCGPLSRVWCMRFEAKHSHLKHLARISRNFKNIPKTLATRHQNYMCLQLLNKQGYLQSQIQFCSETPVVLNSIQGYEEVLSVAPELTEDLVVLRVRSVKIDGSEYRKSVVVLCHFEEHMPVFGEVIDIIVTPLQECLFLMHPLVADFFDRHYHAYHVVQYNHLTLVYRHSEFHDRQVLHTNRIHSTIDHSLYVCVKYHVFE